MLRRLFRCVVILTPLLLATASASGAKQPVEKAGKPAASKPKAGAKGASKAEGKAQPETKPPKTAAVESKPPAPKPKQAQPKSKRTAKAEAPAKPGRSSKGKLTVRSAKPKPRRSNAARFLEVPSPEELAQTPAYVYANYTNEQAYAELERRGVAFRRELPGPEGVRAPIRLMGPLHGVHIHSSLPAAERASSPFELLDARLALALDDFCALLEQHEIVELVHFTMYRAGHSPRAESDALPTRHPGGLAIDVGALRKRSGEWLDVGQHWASDIGAKTCGAGAKAQLGQQAQELVGLVCDTARNRVFHYMLTPHYDAPHHDHLHLEIKPAVKWFLVN